MNNTIALCVPAYKAERYISGLLDSALRQTHSFDEIIVCVDASPDNTANIARQYGVTVIENKVNQGCSASKNNALRASTSDWVHFHDADDLLLPNFTKLAKEWVARDKCPDVVLFDYEYRDFESNQKLFIRRFDSDRLRNDALRYAILNQINPFCGLYNKRKLLEVGGYDVDPLILYNEDVAFHCKLAVAGFSFDSEEEVSIVNHRIGGSMSQANQLKCSLAQLEIMRRLSLEVGATHGDAISLRLWSIAGHLMAFNDMSASYKAIDLAMQLSSDVAKGQGIVLKSFSRIVGPKMAYLLREKVIRLFKPHLRKSINQ